MKAKEIDKNTWLITRGEAQASIHNYLLVGDQRAALIDTGLESETLREFAKNLTKKPIVVLHSHGHIDHIGNDQQFDKIMLNPADFALYHLQSSAKFRSEFFKAQYVEKKINDSIEAEAYALEHHYAINQNVSLDPLTNGMTIDLGNRELFVIENPGHTKGCISLIEKDKRYIFTGDMVCEMGVIMHFPESTSIDTYINSLEKIRRSMTPEFQLYAGHQFAPLTIEWVDKYIDCASELIDFGKSMIKNDPTVQGTNDVLFYSKDKARISYTTNKLLKSIRDMEH